MIYLEIMSLIRGQCRVSHSGCLGLALGSIASLTIGKSLSALLYGTSPTNLSVILPVVCIFAIAAVAATSLPCRRAAKIEPMEALRTE
jgi:ABC-type antimicrobial peptide transport system permease subunit